MRVLSLQPFRSIQAVGNSCTISHHALGGAVEEAMCSTPQGPDCKLRRDKKEALWV